MILVACVVETCGTGGANPVAEPASAPLSTPPAGVLVAAGDKPEGIAYDPASGVLAIGVRNPDAVLFLDRSGKFLRRVAVSAAPRHLRFAAPGGPLLVPAEKSGELDVVNVPAGEVIQRLHVGRQPHDAVGAHGRFFITNEFSDTVSVIENSELIANVSASAQPGGIAATSSFLGVVGLKAHVLEVIDASTFQQIAIVPAGVGPTHVVADSETFYVIDTNGNAVFVLATAPCVKVLFRVAVAGKPYGVALDPDRRRLWITQTSTNSLAEVSLNDWPPKLVATFASVRQPNSVAVDASTGRVFVTGTGDGVIQILDPQA